MASTEPFSVVIVGGGLVGSLAAVFCAKRGWKVDLYELRQDPRKDASQSGRSINLALSVRGISALRAAGVEEKILNNMIPMKGRMIHTRDGKLSSQPYGIFGECINSVDRMLMNKHLLDSVEKLPNVKLHFEHDLKQCDFDARKAVFARKDGSSITVHADLIIGADGAHSRTRQQLMRRTRVNFSQSHIDHGYVELTIPPTQDGDYAMDAHHLHIWPRQTFMMIALPNLDKSFTVTLFMPWSKFEAICTEEDLVTFFEETFPDSVPLMGQKLLVQEYFKNSKGSLIQIKARPYHFRDRVVVIGDAAHAMVPFYGQGMNCGMEDCLVLESILTKHCGLPSSGLRPNPNALACALEEYTNTRNPDAEAMCDLAMYNYIEMRSSVTKAGYLFRKTVEGWLHRLMPTVVIPLYTMVSFTRIPYAEAMRRWERQSKWFDLARWIGEAVAISTVVGAGLYWGARWRGVREVLWRQN
ncbi:kynurenine 3-monooxygenase [Spizellomyces sp. 'palustris']|nr:kynurenine 3-monooxygenase [Spizellomyces sp. 'palustris']